MTDLAPKYRMTVYGANANGTDAATPLSPRPGSPHALEFKVATAQGVAGFHPYMDFPQGRRGKIDPLSRKVDKGSITLRVFDIRNTPGGSNFSRFATAYVGDAEGQTQLISRRVFVEEWNALTSAWVPFYTGRIYRAAVDARLWMTFTIRDMAEELDWPCFAAAPYASIAYACAASVLPPGPSKDYGGFRAAPKIPGKVAAWSAPGGGSGKSIQVDLGGVVLTDPSKSMLTIQGALAEMLDEVHVEQESATTLRAHPDLMVEMTSGAQTGRFLLVPHKPTGTVTADYVGWRGTGPTEAIVVSVGIAEVDATDPHHLAMPADGATVAFRLLNVGEARDGAPLYIGDIHPAQLWADILDGKFGRLHPDGTVRKAIARDAAAFTTMIADTSIPTGRFIIDQPFQINDFTERHLCLPYNLAYRLDAEGEVVPIDMRPPASLAGLATLTNADVSTSRAPSWGVDLSSASAIIEVEYYSDHQAGGSRPWDYARGASPLGRVLTFAPSAVESIKHRFIKIDPGSPAISGARPFKIDALGIRYAVGGLLVSDTPLTISALLARLVEEYRGFLTGGLAIALMACRRTATTNALQPGAALILDVDELPDPATNLRGGPRVVRCVERTERGVHVEFSFADLGPNSVAVAPALGAVATVSGETATAVELPVTLNAAGEPAEVWIAITETSVGTRPAEGSALWIFGARATATGTVRMGNLPGKRVWARGRTVPAGAKAAKLPSGWVFPSGAGRVDLSGITAPSGIAAVAGYPTGTEHKVTFTVGHAAYLTDVLLGGVQIDTLPAGSTSAHLRSLAISTAYVLGLRHRDPVSGGTSSTVNHNFNTTGTKQKAPPMLGIGVLVGETS